MKRIWVFLLLLVFAVLLSSCATSTVTSFKDKACGDSKYGNILVAVHSNNNLELRKLIEDKMVERLKKQHVSATQSYLAFPPTKDYSKSEIADVLRENNFDSMLTIEYSEVPQNLDYHPQQAYYINNTSKQKPNSSDNSNDSGLSGYGICRLVDLNIVKNVWMAESKVTIGGPLFNGNDEFADEATETICEKLVQDKMLK